MNAGSWNSILYTMPVGQRRYYETTYDEYASDMRTINTPPSRRPPEMYGMQFSATLFTAVSARSAGDVRYIICVERTL